MRAFRCLFLLVCVASASDFDRSRFWKHHVTQESLVIDGVDHYATIKTCLHSKLPDSPPHTEPRRRVRRRLGDIVAVEIHEGISEAHAYQLEALATCVRTHIPSLYEVRAMYKEMNIGYDDGSGGNSPTHLVPLVSVFLPDVVQGIYATLQTAFDTAGWQGLVARDQVQHQVPHKAYVKPQYVGIRASEFLNYDDFPNLSPHTDGASTLYTLNCALSDQYTGGQFYLIDDDDKYFFKPPRLACLVFLGGEYEHGVTQIKSGRRTMWSTEFWPYPDLPAGNTLWTSRPGNMETYIELCNAQNATVCTLPFPTRSTGGKDVQELRDAQVMEENHATVELSGYLEDEEDFLILKDLQPGQMQRMRWRESLLSHDNEAYAIGFPPELDQEIQAYIRQSGLYEAAYSLLYEEKPLRKGDHRLYTLKDGHQWGAMSSHWKTDMVWLDPANEDCFESLVAMLGRGGFDVVLDAIGRQFDLDGLMIQGVGAIFLSEYQGKSVHVDISGTRGSFYNIVIPVHIPEGRVAPFIIGDKTGKGQVKLRPNRGFVLGGETKHGTGAVNYRDIQDYRFSFAIYVADINMHNIKAVADDTTSLWPPEGDMEWFWTQKGRFWREDGSRSMANDVGRKKLTFEDQRDDCQSKPHLCETDLVKFRLQCPKTCRVYTPEEEYRAFFSSTAPNKTKERVPSSSAGVGEVQDEL